MKPKYLILSMALFFFLILFSTPSFALIPGDFGSAGGGPPDGVVDFEDLMIFAMAYGSTPADANWNLLCDIYPDGVIDFEDLMIFAMHYGESSIHNLTKDTYYNTIQAALDDADSANTIEVGDGTYTGSISFPSDKVIILQSVNGASSTIIQGNDGSDTVTFDGSLSGTSLEGFTITHLDGLIRDGICITNSNLSINECTISGNTADNDSSGIYNMGTLTITNCTISNNSSTNDDFVGIFNEGTLTAANCTISGNSATFCLGIANMGTLTAANCTISGNSGNIICYGIANTGSLTITGSIISDNYSNNDLCVGVLLDSGTLTITASTISNNYSNNICGGIIINSSDILLSIAGSTVSDNIGCYGCAGIYFDFPTSETFLIGGDSEGEKNTICGNYNIGDEPFLEQQILDASGSLYETYKDTNHISAYCE